MNAITRVHRLVGPYGAVPGQAVRPADAIYPPWLQVFQATPSTIGASRPGLRMVEISSCGGRSDSADRAWRIAVIEALERYASFVTPPGLVFGSGSSTPYAVNPDLLPRHSDQELIAHPHVTRLDQDSEVRWASGVDLGDGSPARLPAVMVHMGLDPLPSERFWSPISTGVAAGGTREDALFAAICEVIERDMISVVWLQRLVLPRLAVDALTPQVRRLAHWCERKYLEAHLFDATADVGVPTVYCVLRAPHDALVGLTVGAATHADLGAAAAHAMGEALTIRSAIHHAVANPDPEDQMMQGAMEVGRPERKDAFEFLLQPSGPLPDRQLPRHDDLPLTGPDRLENLVRRCERAGHKVYAFDLTTPELREIGLHVVRASIPSMQPLAFGLGGRYLGHPRLYQVPALLGCPVLPEGDLNHRPQPFA